MLHPVFQLGLISSMICLPAIKICCLLYHYDLPSCHVTPVPKGFVMHDVCIPSIYIYSPVLLQYCMIHTTHAVLDFKLIH